MIALLDTSVISQFTKQRPEAAVLRWLERVRNEDLCLSAVTILEIRYGVERMPAGRRRAGLLRWLEEELKTEYAGRIFPVDEEVADLAGRLLARSQRASSLHMDVLIAATAILHNVPVATLNRRDFAGLGVDLIDFV